MTQGHGRALARAALAGNPSDGYGGAVLAVTLKSCCAEVYAVRGPMPGSPAGVRLAMEKVILPELAHLVREARR